MTLTRATRIQSTASADPERYSDQTVHAIAKSVRLLPKADAVWPTAMVGNAARPESLRDRCERELTD